MRKGYSIPQRLAATVLGRMMGAEAAADTLGMDRRTVRGWLSKASEPDEADAWTAAQQLAQQQLTERLAAGKVTNPVTLATIAGIASRNVRYSKLIKEREARKAEEQPDGSDPNREAMRDVVNRLDDLRRRYLAVEIDLIIRRRAEDLDPEPEKSAQSEESDAWLSAHADALLAMSDDEIRERTEAMQEELRELNRQQIEQLEAERAASVVTPPASATPPVEAPAAPPPRPRLVNDDEHLWHAWRREPQ